MSGRSGFTIAAVIAGVASIGMLGATSEMTAAPATPTTTVAATTAARTLTPTTLPGPAPRPSERVASPIDIEKIRATSLPLRTMGIAVGVAIMLLAIAGFVYGKLSSRLPTVKAPKVVTAVAGPAAPASAAATAPLPPPAPVPLPPPMVEDAEADTVMFEPPPTHRPPAVIATADPEPDDAEPAEIEPAEIELAEIVDANSVATDETTREPGSGTEAGGSAVSPAGPDRS